MSKVIEDRGKDQVGYSTQNAYIADTWYHAVEKILQASKSPSSRIN